jgi:hypothetical protein
LSRILFDQTDFWPGPCGDVYSQENCCYCAKPVKVDAKRLRMIRTRDGWWWLVSSDYQIDEDDMGDGIFTLPVGSNCLKKHPEWKFAVVPELPEEK